MNKFTKTALVLSLCAGMMSCTSKKEEAASSAPAAPGGAASVQDDVSQKNVVQIAVGSKDHTTLVKAVQAAGLVDSLANPGPFTVFAPTDAAFAKLPAGTVEGLLKADKKKDLSDILEYHVFVGILREAQMTDGQEYSQANGSNIKIKVKDGKTYVNDAAVVATVPASNGIVYVIDSVLLPPAKK